MHNLTDLIAEIAAREMLLYKRENEIKDLEQKIQSTRGNRTAGGLALLIGLLGFLVFDGAWFLWIFLLLIGGATYLTAWVKQHESKNSIREHQQEMESIRLELTQKKMLLMHGAQAHEG